MGVLDLMRRKLVLTEDGSLSLFVENLNEYYHSKYGAVQESMHIYIQAGLLSETVKKLETIHILEMGFGTGLNAFLTYFSALDDHKTIHYTTIEPYPLTFEEVQLLNYADFIENFSAKSVFQQIHNTVWEKEETIGNHFTICKHKQSALDFFYPCNLFDLVYFDAFAPDIQPDLWGRKLFEKIYQSMKQDGILVTYSTKGNIKRTLKEIGFHLEKLPGPKGKREMLRVKK